MGIDISVLMGANIASEVAAEKFCETTIGEGCWGLDMWCFKRTFSIAGIFCSGLFPAPLTFLKWTFRGVGILRKEAILWNWSVSTTSRMKVKPWRPFGPAMIQSRISRLGTKMWGYLYQEAVGYTHGGASLALETQLFFTHRCWYLDLNIDGNDPCFQMNQPRLREWGTCPQITQLIQNPAMNWGLLFPEIESSF